MSIKTLKENKIVSLHTLLSLWLIVGFYNYSNEIDNTVPIIVINIYVATILAKIKDKK